MTDFQYQLLEVNFLSFAIICGAVVLGLLAVLAKRSIQKFITRMKHNLSEGIYE